MDQAHKDILRRNYMQLTEYIMPCIETVCRNLWTTKVISRHMLEDILEGKNTNRKKAMALLDLLPSRGPYAFELFFKSLEANELFEAAYILKPNERKEHVNVNVSFAPKREIHVPVRERIIEEDKLPDDNLKTEVTEPQFHTLSGGSDHIDRVPASSAAPLEQPNHLGQHIKESLIIHEFRTFLNKEDDSCAKEPMQPPAISQNLTLAHMDKKLPENWPSEEDLKNLQVALVEDHSHMAQLFRYVHATENQHVYSMKNKIKGNVLIIDNFLFKHFDMRDGSKKDRDAMKILFESLGFNVVVHKNLTMEKMLSVMKEESKKVETWHECFVLVILSHGCNGYVFCHDSVPLKGDGKPENAIHVDDIREMFCLVKNLCMKPKVFFIQACRGVRKDKGLDIDALNRQEVKQTLISEESDGHGSRHPIHSDCFIAMSVTAGIASWRRTDIGTWFIQAVAYIFSHYAKDFDMQDLMTLVNNLVARATTQKGFKQVSEQSSTFRKKFYFFPGLCEENIQM